MISRADIIAQQIVALIDPDKDRRNECMIRAQLSVRTGTARRADLPWMFHSGTKRAKRAATRLCKALDRLQDVLADPDLAEDLRPGGRWSVAVEAKRLARWRQQAGEDRTTTLTVPRGDMLLKVSAAESAYRLHQRFKKKIVMTKGSTFCRVAALLYGKPKANMQNACREVISRWSMKKTLADLPYAAEALLRPYRADDH
jgi:hypothetical protein